MKSFAHRLAVSLALAIGFALVASTLHAAGPAVDTRVARLDTLVTLTAEQKAKVADVFRMEDAALDALPQADRGLKGMEARQASRDRVRALLTSAQQKIYDRAPQPQGGGLTIAQPANRVAALDASVGLTAAQKPVALQIYQEEFESLLALAPSERPEKGMPFRQASRDQIRAILTPAQLDKMDGARQASAAQANEDRAGVEKLLRGSKNLETRVGSIVSVAMAGSSSTAIKADGSRSGSFGLRVVGGTGTETLTVTWERPTATSEIRITKVEGSGGSVIQL